MAKLAKRVRGEKSARSAISKVCRRERRRSAQNLVGRPGGLGGTGKSRQDQQPLLRCLSTRPCITSTVRAGSGAVSVTCVYTLYTRQSRLHATHGHTVSYSVQVGEPQPHPEPRARESCTATQSYTYTQNLVPSQSHLATLMIQKASESHMLTHPRSLTHSHCHTRVHTRNLATNTDPWEQTGPGAGPPGSRV